MQILQTTTFKKQIKKLNSKDKLELDSVIKKIMSDPSLGDNKKGDLQGIQVYKFKMSKKLTLLAYQFFKEEIKLLLLALGTHENFYRDLKNSFNGS